MNKTPCTTVTNYSQNLNCEGEEEKTLIQMISSFDDSSSYMSWEKNSNSNSEENLSQGIYGDDYERVKSDNFDKNFIFYEK
jgi:hypothetical protein